MCSFIPLCIEVVKSLVIPSRCTAVLSWRHISMTWCCWYIPQKCFQLILSFSAFTLFGFLQKGEPSTLCFFFIEGPTCASNLYFKINMVGDLQTNSGVLILYHGNRHSMGCFCEAKDEEQSYDMTSWFAWPWNSVHRVTAIYSARDRCR